VKKIIILIAIALASCSKSTNDLTPVQKDAINSYDFFPAFAGANESVGFHFTISVYDNVKELDIVEEAISMSVWQVIDPKSGKYTGYDHLGDYPYGTGKMYHFEWVYPNGDIVKEKSFLVN
jgi:hypothetical protein